MKASEFKKLIKESVREAIKEELRDILLEAVKAPKTTIVKESMGHGDILSSKHTEVIRAEKPEVRTHYMDVMKNMFEGKDKLNYNTSDLQPRNINPIEGNLADLNEVGMDDIMKLMNPK